MISEALFQKGFQAWLHKVDVILGDVHPWLTHETYQKTDWRAMYTCGYLAVTAVYEATKGKIGSTIHG